VEDEVSSGLGLLHLINALQEYGINIIAVCTVIEVVNFNAKKMLEEKCGIELISLIKVELE
jgi:orotate phosphoribosyltransferase